MQPQPDRVVRVEPEPIEVTSFGDFSRQFMDSSTPTVVYHTDRKYGLEMSADVLRPELLQYMASEAAKAIVAGAWKLTDIGTPVAFSPCELEIFRSDQPHRPTVVRVALIVTYEYKR